MTKLTASDPPHVRRSGSARRHSAIATVLPVLEMPWRRVLVAVACGAAALGSATALLGCSAWLIARASQQPHVEELTLVVVAVRALGIGRGTFRYLERLASHDVALTGLVRLRERCYVALAHGSSARVLGYRRGDLLDRLGADIDAVGDVVVRGLLPFASAAAVGLVSVIVSALVYPLSGVTLALALLVSGVLAPWLAGRAARAAQLAGAEAATDVTTQAQALMDGLAEVEVAGASTRLQDRLAEAERRRIRAVDAAAGPTAVAAALQLAALGFGVLAPLVPGTSAVAAGTLGAVWLVVVTLLPLAVMEATTVLPSAAAELVRGERAARRVVDLLSTPADATSHGADVPARPVSLVATQVTTGWTTPVLCGVDLALDLDRGGAIALVGPSGSGKTSLLVTLAGLHPPLAGDVVLDGAPLAAFEPDQVRRLISFCAEDAHVFGTSVRENLRLAAGDVDDETLLGPLTQVGLAGWVATLPDGLGTPLASGAADLSGGQRRRLLVARALLTGARVLLLDEPTEHLDPVTGDELLRDLAALGRTGAVTVVVATHRVQAAAGFDQVHDVTRWQARR